MEKRGRGNSRVALWKGVQRVNPRRLYCSKRVAAFLIDETMMQIGSDQAWLWATVEPMHKQILRVYISRHRNMIVAESFLRTLIRIYGKHPYIQMAEYGIQKHVYHWD